MLLDTKCTYLDRFMFSDETTFYKIGTVNTHNFLHYMDHNLHFMLMAFGHHKFSLNVLDGILSQHMISRHFFDKHLTANELHSVKKLFI